MDCDECTFGKGMCREGERVLIPTAVDRKYLPIKVLALSINMIDVLQEDTLLSLYHTSLHLLLEVSQGEYSVNSVRFTKSKDLLGKQRLQYMKDFDISTDEGRSPLCSQLLTSL